jgi:hypothetical protein
LFTNGPGPVFVIISLGIVTLFLPSLGQLYTSREKFPGVSWGGGGAMLELLPALMVIPLSAATQWVKYINKNKIKQIERTAVFYFFGEKSKPF